MKQYTPTLLETAVNIANKAHSGQTRKGSEIAYIIHPMEAAAIASSILIQLDMYDENIVAAAVLHDTLEDTELTVADLKEYCSQKTVDLVLVQSEDKSKSWKERKQHTIETLKNSTRDIDVLIVHLADKLSNMRSISRDVNIIGDELWNRFNQKMKSEQGWYYKSILENLVGLEDVEEYKEYKLLTEKVFGK